MGIISPLHPREIRYPHRQVERVGKNVSLFVSTDKVLSTGMCMHPPTPPTGSKPRNSSAGATYAIELSTVAKQLHHHICLNKGFKSVLECWAQFLPMRNCFCHVCVTPNPQPQLRHMRLVGGAVEHFHLYVVMYIRIVVLSMVLDNRIVNIINMFFTSIALIHTKSILIPPSPRTPIFSVLT